MTSSATALASLIAWRQAARRAEFEPLWGKYWNQGGCAFVSEYVERELGYQRWGGCFDLGHEDEVDSDGQITLDSGHIAHYWNTMADGQIFDATADQFGLGENGIFIGHDRRYLAECSCGGS